MSADAGECLARLLSAPFPRHVEGPVAACCFDAFEEVLAPSPRRLVQVIEKGYFDPQKAPVDAAAIDDQYRRSFAEAVASAEEHFGPALRPDASALAGSGLDQVFFNLDWWELAYWPVGNRLAIIHLGWQSGDDDFEVALSAQITPDVRSA